MKAWQSYEITSLPVDLRNGVVGMSTFYGDHFSGIVMKVYNLKKWTIN